MNATAPGLDTIRDLYRRLGSRIIRPPVLRCAAIEAGMAEGTEVYAKLEFLQRTGTFKARGALSAAMALIFTRFQALLMMWTTALRTLCAAKTM